MQCAICQRTGGQKLGFYCINDARNHLYEPRIQHARVLLDADALDRQISAALEATSSSDASQANQSSDESKTTRWATVSTNNCEREQAADRTQQIIAHADELRAKIQVAREEMDVKRAKLAARRANLAKAAPLVEPRKTNKQLEEVQKSIVRAEYLWDHDIHFNTAMSRAFLCGEAARLYGLKRRRVDGVQEYKIGGISIMDLRGMNSASPAHISTALSHVVHLLMLSTHYLAIRLPAEITLPHRDYPLPTIFTLEKSYMHADNLPFPGTTPSHSSNNSPTTSRHDEAPSQPRPRPLFITKPLPMLAREDPTAHNLFLEGVALLAYDVAWLCKSQGVQVGETNSFEDICEIGKNLYNLLIGQRPRPEPSSPNNPNANPTGSSIPPLTPYVGHYSHGTGHSHLAAGEGTEMIRNWRLPNPTKLMDKLKSILLNEMATTEWEVLDADAWAVDDELGDDGVVVGARREPETDRLESPSRGRGISPDRTHGMQSFMSMRTVMDAVEMVTGDGFGRGDRKAGTSGWTKLKPRG